MRSGAAFYLCCLATLCLSAQDSPSRLRAISVLPGTQPIAKQERRVALVIGNGAYADARLHNPVNDGYAMKEALSSCRFEVTLLTDASRRAMEEAIAAFGDQIKDGAVGLFYFAGHGIQVDGMNFLIPVGAKLNKESDVRFEGVDVGRVLDCMNNAGNKLNILILDACRNNPFSLAKGWRSTGEQGLAQVKAPTGTLVAYATGPGNIAADGNEAHGLFTGALLTEMVVPGLELEKVFKTVREKVLDASKGAQTPWESNSTVGNFYFRPQRTAEDIAKEQAAVQEERRKLEVELKAHRAAVQTAEAIRTAERLKAELRVKELEQERLTQEEQRRQQVESDRKRAQADEARLSDEAARLNALKQRLTLEQEGQKAESGFAGLDALRQEVARVGDQKEAMLKAVQEEKAQALAKLVGDYAGMRAHLEAPRDEFETTAQFNMRQKEAANLVGKMEKEKVAEEGRFLELVKARAKPLDEEIMALMNRKVPVLYPVALGTYNPDKGRFPVRLPAAAHHFFVATLALEPAKARELKSRKELLKAELDLSLTSAETFSGRVLDPVLGGLPLSDVKIAASGYLDSVDVGQGVKLEMAWIPPGQFSMGTLASEPEWLKHARPVHPVTLTKDFWMGKFAVTMAQWQAVMGTKPLGQPESGGDLPVTNVSWEDTQKFLSALNKMQKEWTYRLPTEAEWEYACRAGTVGETYGKLDAVAWYAENSSSAVHAVGQKRPNAFGLYDILGNVWQWCQSFYGEYPAVAVVDPLEAPGGPFRMVRGGSWGDPSTLVRAATRWWYPPSFRDNHVGFRLVRDAR